MNKNTYEKYNDQELIKKKKLFKGVFIGFAILYFAIFSGMGFMYFTNLLKENSYVTFMPLFILPVTLMPLIINLGMLNKELKSRNL